MITVYKGTELKFKLELKALGFSMDDDEFYLELYNSRSYREVIHKSDMEHGNDGWFFTFGTENFGTGVITMKVVADVPDGAFDDNLRTEVFKMELCKVLS